MINPVRRRERMHGRQQHATRAGWGIRRSARKANAPVSSCPPASTWRFPNATTSGGCAGTFLEIEFNICIIIRTSCAEVIRIQ